MKRLVNAGFHVHACVRPSDESAADALRATDIQPVPLDLADPASIAAAARQTLKESGGVLAGLVNLAGMIVDGPLELVAVADFQRQFDVNVTGPFAFTCALAPALRRSRGRVVNIGAVTARTTVPFMVRLPPQKRRWRLLRTPCVWNLLRSESKSGSSSRCSFTYAKLP